ncbi:MAG: hypothetical protein NT062_09775, partial [Proteobacteria bacterium]|nr:hypothetical protein [Pseudomonadota bacterium]
MLAVFVTAATMLAACSDDPVPPDVAVEQPGAHAVGTTRFEVTDAARARTLVVQAWFPTDAAATDTPIEALELEPVR